MSARDWFGVAARVLGIWLLIRAVSGLVMALAVQRGWLGFDLDSTLPKYRLALSAADFIFGLLLLARTQFFIDLTYPEKEKGNADPGEELSSNSDSDG
ncbi:MAG: hypothetical protein IID46_04515 [Planctomycetes bacterium]|nr:hypothetical protein [Planctomycetota bacterium]